MIEKIILFLYRICQKTMKLIKKQEITFFLIKLQMKIITNSDFINDNKGIFLKIKNNRNVSNSIKNFL